MRKYDVPHIPDLTEDSARCVESSFRMVLKYFLPEKEFNWRTLDKMLRKPRKKGAWWFTIYPSLINLGFKVKEYNASSAYGLARYGIRYLYKAYSKKVADNYVKVSNIKDVIGLLPKVLKLKVFSRKIPTLRQIRNLLDNGYLLVADVNFYGLYDKPGFMSHSVAIVGYDSKNIYINDPAKVKGKSVQVPNYRFSKAWHSKGLVALRLNN